MFWFTTLRGRFSFDYETKETLLSEIARDGLGCVLRMGGEEAVKTLLEDTVLAVRLTNELELCIFMARVERVVLGLRGFGLGA